MINTLKMVGWEHMKLLMLGTGHALVTGCYNTCFALQEHGEYFLVDGGGGIGILSQLKKAGIDWRLIKNIFVTHKHIDHLLGVIWLLRVICEHMDRGEYRETITLYAHQELLKTICNVASMLLQAKDAQHIGDQVRLVSVSDGSEYEIMGHKTVFFDVHSTKTKQFGFVFYLNDNEKLSCCGDEPYNALNRKYVEGSKWLLHEAFCLYSDVDVYSPYEMHHSTAKDACQVAEELGVENLILYHTEDSDLKNRKARYTAEGREYFKGGLYIPDDLETLQLS